MNTSFLVISDPHGLNIHENTTHHFRLPLPKVDVLLHYGDLTQIGGHASFRKALKMLGEIDAELKLVIAGNHDLELDSDYWRTHLDEEAGDEPEEHDQAVAIIEGPLAREQNGLATAQVGGTHLILAATSIEMLAWLGRIYPENVVLLEPGASLGMHTYIKNSRISSTYGHSQLKTGHPVRSAIHKQLNGRLVLRWVTTWESLLLYVLVPVFVLKRSATACLSFDRSVDEMVKELLPTDTGYQLSSKGCCYVPVLTENADVSVLLVLWANRRATFSLKDLERSDIDRWNEHVRGALNTLQPHGITWESFSTILRQEPKPSSFKTWHRVYGYEFLYDSEDEEVEEEIENALHI